MLINLETRLRKLEGHTPPVFRPAHRVIGDTAEDCEAKRRAHIESGHAEEADDFMFRIIVGAPIRPGPA